MTNYGKSVEFSLAELFMDNFETTIHYYGLQDTIDDDILV